MSLEQHSGYPGTSHAQLGLHAVPCQSRRVPTAAVHTTPDDSQARPEALRVRQGVGRDQGKNLRSCSVVQH